VTNACEDRYMREMAAEELLEAAEEEKRLQHELFRSLLPKDEADERDCIPEVRAGNPELALCAFTSTIHPSNFQFYSIIGQQVNGDDIIMQELEEKKHHCLRWIHSKCMF
jgi:hypothetical protein